jgi:hypothetical protein
MQADSSHDYERVFEGCAKSQDPGFENGNHGHYHSQRQKRVQDHAPSPQDDESDDGEWQQAVE